jgi:uncharacterized protein
MRRDDVIFRLRQTEPALRALGVGALYLFGSYARDQGEVGSDVDVFVDPAPSKEFGFLPFMTGYEVLQKAFEHRVEIGIRPGQGFHLTSAKTWNAKPCGFSDGGQRKSPSAALPYS